MFSFWGTTPAVEEKKKQVAVVQHPMDFTAGPQTPPSRVGAVEQTHLAGSPMTSDDSYVKLTNSRDFDPLQIERGFSSPYPEVRDKEVTAPGNSKVEALYNLDNLESDRSSFNEAGERYAHRETASFGEETAAAVLEELERQDRDEQQQENIKPLDFAGDEDEIDLVLVEQYDYAFNEFICKNPRFLVTNPDLVHHIRITKLQKLLETHDQIEEVLAKQLEATKTSKLQMELHYQNQLKETSRLKAARDIHWQAHLHEIQQSTRTMECQLKWDLLTASEQRAKKEFAMAQAGLAGLGYGRLALATLVPEGPEFDGIRDAMMAPPNLSNQVHLNEEQEKDLRQFQMDNALLNAELAVLQKKMVYQQTAKKKNVWVESVLVKIEEKTMRKLKAKYQKKTGVLV